MVESQVVHDTINLDMPAQGSKALLLLMWKQQRSAPDAEDTESCVVSYSGLCDPGTGVEAMKAVAKAYQARSLQDFQSTLTAYKEELVDDGIVHLHLSRLYDTLLEQNLCRLIEPYSRVEIEYLAKLIKLPTSAVLTKLSQVIDTLRS